MSNNNNLPTLDFPVVDWDDPIFDLMLKSIEEDSDGTYQALIDNLQQTNTVDHRAEINGM